MTASSFTRPSMLQVAERARESWGHREVGKGSSRVESTLRQVAGAVSRLSSLWERRLRGDAEGHQRHLPVTPARALSLPRLLGKPGRIQAEQILSRRPGAAAGKRPGSQSS